MVELNKEYKVKSFSIKNNTQNKKQATLTLKDINTGICETCNLWQDAINNTPEYYFKTANTIKITVGYKKGDFPFNVNSVELVKEAKAGLNISEREKLFNIIISELNCIQDKTLKSAIKNVVEANKEKFMIVPAAKNFHHNYVGGLMQHICECIELSETVLSKFKIKINKELIIAACITHDIGKIFEYKINIETGVVETNEGFRKEWISHTQYGFSWAMSNNLKQLAQIIAAHHGRTDWGAIIDLEKNDLAPEMYLMHHIDNLSSRFGAITVEELEN